MMISSVNALATHAVTVLTGQKRATVPVEPVAPVKVVKRRTGHTDDVFKAGNAIGSMIMIAARMDPSSRPVTPGDADAVDDPGTGPFAGWAKAYLETQERRRDSDFPPTRRDP